MIKDRVCQHCDVKFIQIEGRTFSNHVKWCDKRDYDRVKLCQWCKCDVASNNLKTHESACFESPKNVCKKSFCLWCEMPIVKKSKLQKFCNHKCHATFYAKKRKNEGWVSPSKGRTSLTVDKKCEKCGNTFQCSICSPQKMKCNDCVPKCKSSSKKYDNNGFRLYNGIIEIKKCEICDNNYEVDEYSGRKTCSIKCRRELFSRNSLANNNCGGETNYKKFKYKDQWFDSSWEIEFAKFLDKNGVDWVRSKKLCFFWFDGSGKKRRYYPDFYIGKYDLYVDTKNKYLLIQDAFKIEQVRKNNKINLIVDTLDSVILCISKIMGL